MKKSILILLLALSVLAGCKKGNTGNPVPASGTVTINNDLFGSGPYYSNGFSFSMAKKVSSLANPKPDVVIYVKIDALPNTLTLQADNFLPSFYKLGEYADAPSAVAAYENLKTVGAYQWAEMADEIKPNQVWVYRTGSECYAKFRIITTVNEVRNNIPYGECTFEWVYQPDGSTTFTGK